MLTLVLRRTLVQRRLLAAVVLVIAVATTLVGVCTLLLGVSGARAFSEEIGHAQPQDVDVTAYLLDLPGSRLGVARQAGREVVRDALAPLPSSLSSTATSEMRRLEDSDALSYLATSDDLDQQATLRSGRWPTDGTGATLEAVAPEAAAERLHLRLGDRVTLGSETGLKGVDRPVRVVVVGTFRASSRAAWTSDPLSGGGFTPAYSDGSVTAPAYGPFLLGPDAFAATGSRVSGLRVDGHPALADADDDSLSAAAASLRSASGRLSADTRTSARITRVASNLPDTLSRIHAQQATTRSAVLAVLLLGTTLAVAALLLAARLVEDSRTEERALLTAMGLSARQQLGAALLEAVPLAVVSAVVALPTAAVAHSLVTHLPDLEAAGLAQAPTVTWSLVLTVLLVALLLALVLVLSPLARVDASRLPARRRALARSSVDALMLLVAVACWWLLRSRPETDTSGDFVLVLAPVLFLTAVTVLAVRLLPPLLALLAAAGSRSRDLLPLSLHPAALRLSSAAPLVLLTTASAAAAFGLALHTTWERSQADQADLRVGTSLALTLAAAPAPEEVAAVGAAAAGARDGRGTPVVSSLTRRPLALGRYVGSAGDPPEIVAVDSRRAGALLRGRLDDGRTWAEVGRKLAPGPPARGLPLPAGAGDVQLQGRSARGVPLVATPSVVVQDASGQRSVLEAADVRLDGRAHPLRWITSPTAGQRIVALDLVLVGEADAQPGPLAAASVQLRVRGQVPGTVPTWHVQPLGRDSPVRGQSVDLRQDRGVSVLSIATQLDRSYLPYSPGHLLATAFDPPAAVPVAVAQGLVDAIGTKIGAALSATIDDTVVPLRVVAVVPTVPSAPGRIAVLADVDTLSRALISSGRLEPAVDGFWVSPATSRTASAVRALELGEVSTRSEAAAALSRGPMQVTVPVAYLTLVVAALLLLVAGALLVVSADQRSRSAEVMRLRALGLTRAGARRLLLAEHSAVLVPLVLAGILVGGVAAAALGTTLVRSDAGTAPVPSALLQWPWGAELLLAGGVVLGCLVVAGVAAAWQVRRSDASRLRTVE